MHAGFARRQAGPACISTSNLSFISMLMPPFLTPSFIPSFVVVLFPYRAHHTMHPSLGKYYCPASDQDLGMILLCCAR